MLVKNDGARLLAVLRRLAVRDHRRRVVDQLTQERARFGRRRDQHARARAESEPEHQHVPRVLQVAPRRELVGPREVVLRAAEAVGLVGGIQRRDRAVRPRNAAFRRLVFGLEIRVMDGEQPRLPFDHDVSGVRRGRRDECHARRATREDFFAHELRADAGFAPAAPGHREPLGPLARGRHLVVARPQRPVVEEVECVLFRQGGEEGRTLSFAQRGERFFQRDGRARSTCADGPPFWRACWSRSWRPAWPRR
jgi:hypothetical protein